jgi:hypothetical protein
VQAEPNVNEVEKTPFQKLMEAIRHWLQSKDYIEGVRIYLQHGQDPVLKNLFTAEKGTPYKQQRLERALREILAGTEVVKPEERPASSLMKSWPIEAASDDVLKALRAEWLKAFKEMHDLRSQLMLLANDDQRGEAAHRILDLDDLCYSIYLKRNHYLEHGTLPEAKKEEYIVDPLKAAKRMEILGRYIRRERTALKKDPSNVGAAARKQKFTNEYNHYAQRFGADHIQEEAEADPAAQK